jgi:hypothetical protein
MPCSLVPTFRRNLLLPSSGYAEEGHTKFFLQNSTCLRYYRISENLDLNYFYFMHPVVCVILKLFAY